MPIIGTYRTDVAFDKVRINAMCRQTTDESLSKLQSLIKKHTPVGGPYGPYMTSQGHRSGKLRDSIQNSGGKRVSTNMWSGKVYSNLEYAAAIEYGMSPRHISAKPGEELLWFTGNVPHYAHEVTVKGYHGRFMFHKGAEEFERLHAHEIAANNARIYLHAVDAR